jgi:four helix bundle protein
LRSGTCVARSRAEFIARIGTVVEEADETVFWLELLVESNLASKGLTDGLLKEANELLAIFAASQRTAKIVNDSMKNRLIKN